MFALIDFVSMAVIIGSFAIVAYNIRSELKTGVEATLRIKPIANPNFS